MQIKGKAAAAVTRGLEAGKCHTTFEVKLIEIHDVMTSFKKSQFQTNANYI